MSGEEKSLLTLGVSDILKIKPYLPGKPIEEVKRQLGLKTIIKLASNENPLGPSPRAVRAIKKYASEVNFYPDGGGYYLKRALAKGLAVEDSNIILGNGSDEILSLVTRLFLRKGEEAITGDPSFLMYKIDIQLAQGRLVSIPLRNFQLDLERMEKAITSKTRLIFIGNPNNPTGTIVKKGELEQFLKDVPPRILVVFDEAYYEYVEDADYPQTLDLVRKKRNVVVLRTFSKIYGLAGLRIGYGVARKEIIDVLNRARPPFNVNSLAQVAALESLKDQDQIKRTRRLIKQGKEFLYFHLKELGLFFIPTQSNFILIKMGQRAKEIEDQLLKKGIIIRGMGGYDLPQYVRVTMGTKEQNEELIQNLRTMLSSS